jgi:hypothetical protein
MLQCECGVIGCNPVFDNIPDFFNWIEFWTMYMEATLIFRGHILLKFYQIDNLDT